MLKENEIISYWKTRSSIQGDRTVGYAGKNIIQQDINYKIRKKFIFEHCPKNLKTLDYGCGTGRYSYEFSDYIGVDITTNLLNIAKINHPDKNFILLNKPFLDDIDIDFNLFFTATVLQHNSDDVVRKIFKSISKIKQRGILFSIYENSQDHGKHVTGRNSKDYIAMIDIFFSIISYNNASHIIHSKKHNITLVQT